MNLMIGLLVDVMVIRQQKYVSQVGHMNQEIQYYVDYQYP